MARHGGGRELTRSTELKQLIRSGIPRNYRTQIWKWLTKYIVGKKYVSTALPMHKINECVPMFYGGGVNPLINGYFTM